MREDFYQLILKISRENIKKFSNICLLGDIRQTIYRFGNADERYMLQAPQNFGSLVSTKDWKTVTLHQSFRVPKEVCVFLNKAVLHEERIWSNKSFAKPVYINCEIFGTGPYEYLMEIMEKHNYKPEDIFILAPSVKPSETSTERPTKKLQNLITKKNNMLRMQGRESEILPIYTTEDEQFSQKDVNIMDKKIVVASCHKVKGLERKCVFLFGFDDGCYEVYKDDDRGSLPNPMYVGATRCTELLVVFQHTGSKKFSFLSEDFGDYCDYIDICPFKPRKQVKKEELSTEKFYHSITSVTALLKHISYKDLLDYNKRFDSIKVAEPTDPILINNCPKQKNGLSEEVAEINGTGIIAYFEWLVKKKLTIFDKLEKNDFENNSVDVQKLFQPFGSPEFPVVNNYIIIGKLLKLAVWYCARSVGLTYKLDQITAYDWLPKNTLDSCARRLEKHISKNANFEVNCKCDITVNGQITTIFGAIDCVDGYNVWEFKCVSQLTIEHFLQLAMYAHMWILQNPNDAAKMKFYLFNVLSNEQWELVIDTVKTEEMIKLLISKKLGVLKNQSDQEFSQKIQEIQMTQDVKKKEQYMSHDPIEEKKRSIDYFDPIESDDDVEVVPTPEKKPIKARAKIIKLDHCIKQVKWEVD